METGEQGEAARLEDARGQEEAALLEGAGVEARLLGWRRLVQGDAAKLQEAVYGEVEMVRWRWRGGDGEVEMANWRGQGGDDNVEMTRWR